jgi:stage V sporulation protein AE
MIFYIRVHSRPFAVTDEREVLCLEKFLFAFLVGGGICVIGQILMDVFKLTPAHTMCTLVVVGAALGGFGLYEPLIEFAGAGASVPISSFGNALVKGALFEAERDGFIGVITGIFEVTSAGVSAAIIFGFLGAILFKPRG